MVKKNRNAKNRKRSASTDEPVVDETEMQPVEKEEEPTESEISSESEAEEQSDKDDVMSESESEEEQEGENDDDDEEEAATADKEAKIPDVETLNENAISDGRYRNKQRCLILCSRGVTARYRHLLEDLRTLIPHHKKDSKLDPGKSTPGSAGGVGHAVNEICDVKSCNSFIFLECKKRGQDAYLYVGYPSKGPSAKFHLANVHTMDELRMTGNCMKGSRPLLTFDESFGRVPHLKLLKAMFIDIFGTPRGHPKSKPFVDRVMGFYFADNKIWVRNYQIQEEQATNAKETAELKRNEKGGTSGLQTSLIEIGPRFVLNPIRIFSGSFWGQTLYQNAEFVSPSTERAERLRQKGGEYKLRKESQNARKKRKGELVLEKDPLDYVFR